MRSHNYTGKHGRKAILGAVLELGRSARVVPSFQTRTCNELELIYERRVGRYPLISPYRYPYNYITSLRNSLNKKESFRFEVGCGIEAICPHVCPPLGFF